MQPLPRQSWPLPPQVNSVANACGTCHGKVAGLFNKTQMRRAFEQVGLPGCATCHSNHKILSPGDQMLGDTSPEVCSRCHADGASKGPNAAILAGFDMKRIIHGGEVAKTLRNSLDGLKQKIDTADASLEKAARLGMFVPGPQSNPRLDPRIYLLKASDALTNARVEIHTFDAVPVEKIINQGQAVAAEVQASADKAMEDYRFRRIWLAGSLVPIGLVVLLLFRSLSAARPFPRRGMTVLDRLPIMLAHSRRYRREWMTAMLCEMQETNGNLSQTAYLFNTGIVSRNYPQHGPAQGVNLHRGDQLQPAARGRGPAGRKPAKIARVLGVHVGDRFDDRPGGRVVGRVVDVAVGVHRPGGLAVDVVPSGRGLGRAGTRSPPWRSPAGW